MKSEHRHELAENDLSKLLARWGTEFDKHANTILSVLIVIALIAAGVIYWTRTSAATSAAGWTDLTRAGTAEDFQNVAQDYPGTQVAQWAMLRAGDGFLREGIRLSLTDRTASDERLSQARESYDALLKNTSIPGVLREQALLGYAVTLETMSDGDTTEAVSAYDKLLEEFPASRFKEYAAHRAEELKTGGAQDFYAWYHQLNPKPAERPGPQDQLQMPDPGNLSNMLQELGGSGIPLSTSDAAGTKPEGSDEKVNPFAAEEPASTPGGAPADGSDAAGTDTKPEGTAPEGEKPADTPPNETETDKTDKPAASAEQPAAEEPAPAESDKPAEEEADPASE